MKRINPIPSPKKINYSEDFIPFKISGAKISGECGEKLENALDLLGIGKYEEGNLEIYCGEEFFTKENAEALAFFDKERFAKKKSAGTG